MLPLGMLVVGEIAEVVGASRAITLSVLSGAVLMTVFLRFRPEASYMSQSVRESTVEEYEQPDLPEGRRPDVFNLKPL